MKIKNFKDKSQEYYFWLFSTDLPYFAASIYEFDLPEEQKKEFINICCKVLSKKGELVYIAPYEEVSYSWMPYPRGKDYYEKEGFIFKGKVVPSDEDVEKWSIKLMANKYNL